LGIVASIFDSLPAFDTLKNVVTKLGVPGKSKSHAWVYDYCPIDQLSAESAYCSDWLARKIVDLLPKHATREWRTWQADQAEQIYAVEKEFQVRSKVREALVYDRLYGGGAILIGAQTANPEKPLRIDQVGKGGLKYLHVFHRWQLIDGDIITDLDSPDFGKPEFYNLVASEGVDNDLTKVRIHRSRFVFFTSIRYPGNTVLNSGLFSRGWGQSVYDHVMRAIIRAEAATENAAALMEEAKIDVISVPDLPGQLSTGQGQAKLITRFTLANQLKSSNSLLLLGGEEKFDRKQISFAGLPELMQTHLQISAGAADIPVVVLLGQSPAGLNATGESDTRMWYDTVKNFQGTDLQDTLSPLDEVLIRHALGRVPKGMEYEWDSLWQMSEAERADIAVKKATAIKTYVDTALFAPEELRPAVADMIIDDGFLPTLDQHMLDEDQMAELLSQQQEAAQQAREEAQAAQGEPGTGEQGGQAPEQPGSGGAGLGASGGSAGDVPRLRLVSGTKTTDSTPRTLYVRRDVLNGAEIIAHYEDQGIQNLEPASGLHVTLICCKTPVDWIKVGGDSIWGPETEIIISPGGARVMEAFDEDALVLEFASHLLTYRNQELREAGAMTDSPEYRPHVTIAHKAGVEDPTKVSPWQGEIRLGPEIFEEVNEDWQNQREEDGEEA
jgi:phage-related protein (TIGR01555 family)